MDLILFEKNLIKRRFIIISYIFLLIILIINFGFSTYPSLTLDKTDFISSSATLSGTASSGLLLKLYINKNYEGEKEVLSEGKIINLDGSPISSYSIPIGSKLEFVNTNKTYNYKLNISDFGIFKTLYYGDKLDIVSYKLGDHIIIDENSKNEGKITITNNITNFSFGNIVNNLINGKNNISILAVWPINNPTNHKWFNFSISYKKYTNDIEIKSYKNLTNKLPIIINGTVSNSSSELFYYVGEYKAINKGVLNPVKLNGTKFSVKITDLNEGNNTINFISLNKNNNNIIDGWKKIIINLDTTPPYLRITGKFYNFISHPNIDINISSDGYLLNYTLNDKNYSVKVKNGSVLLSLSLVKGKNNLTLIAIDKAGNTFKEAHAIYYSNEAPKIIQDSLEPKLIFHDKISHQQFQLISGKTNQPDTEVTVFTFPDGTKYTDSKGNTYILTCDTLKNSLYGSGNVNYPEDTMVDTRTNETHISLADITGLNKISFTTDDNGNFKNKLISFTPSANSHVNSNNQMNSVSTGNTICFVMKNKFGLVNDYRVHIKFDTGNTLWIPTGGIITIPNTVYAAEIEQLGDFHYGTGNVKFTVIAKFHYTGLGDLTDLRMRIFNDRGYDSKYARIETNRVYYVYDPSTKIVTVTFPVDILKMNKKPLDYPKKLIFPFAATVTYSVNEKDVPIDNTNPIYFRAVVNVERPLDHAKWLTPHTIDSIISFLNKTIKYTKQAKSIMGFASIGGVVSCTAAKFYYGFLIATAKKQSQINDYYHSLYKICDRVICSASPPECNLNGNTNGYVNVPSNAIQNGAYSKTLDSNDFDTNLEYKDKDGMIVGKLDDVRFSGSCDLPNGQKGVIIQGKMTTYKHKISPNYGGVVKLKDTYQIVNKCVPATYNPKTKKLKSVDLNAIGSVCYNPNPPFFDDTRCWLPGLGSSPNHDPASNILESVRCGCITDTYSHLSNILRIELGIKKCLEQAKLGVTQGSYCERLMGQAVCDIVTNVVLPEVLRNVQPGRTAPGVSGDTHKTNLLESIHKVDAAMKERYAGSAFYNALGFSSYDLENKMCVAAVTGDWSSLQSNILSALGSNQVEPTFGPPFPVSRVQGYNPFTGQLDIRYLFTVGALSGGQVLNIKYQFVCDKNQPGGEYCPSSQPIISDNIPGSQLRSKVFVVSKGSSMDKTVVVDDNAAKYWYNILRVTATYQMNGKQETYNKDFKIAHKEETMLAECHFDASIGAGGFANGFICQKLFTNTALGSFYKLDKTKTTLLPKEQAQTAFYPGNNVYLKIAYTAIGTGTFDKDMALAYIAKCNEGDKVIYLGKGGVSGNPPIVLDLGNNLGNFGTKVLNLFQVPSLSVNKNNNVVYKLDKFVNLDNYNNNLGILITPANTNTKVAFSDIYLTDTSGKVLTQLSNFKNVIIQPDGTTGNNAISQLIPLNLDTQNAKGNVMFNLKASSKLSDDIKIYLVKYDKTKEGKYENFNTIGAFYSSGNFEPGQCLLELRLMPLKEAEGLTISNFETYNSLSSSIKTSSSNSESSSTSKNTNNNGAVENTEDNNKLIASSNLVNNQNEVIKIPFTISNTKAGTKPLNFIDLIYPENNFYVCLDNKNYNLPIYIIYQSSDNSKMEDLTFKYQITAEGYGILNKGNFDISNLCNQESVNINLNTALKNALNKYKQESSDNFEQKANNFISGTTTLPKFILTYDIYDINGNKIKSDSVSFYPNINENCQNTANNFFVGNICSNSEASILNPNEIINNKLNPGYSTPDLYKKSITNENKVTQ